MMNIIELRPQCPPFKEIIINTKFPEEFIQKRNDLVNKNYNLQDSTPNDVVIHYCRSLTAIPSCALYYTKLSNIYGYMYYITRVYDIWLQVFENRQITNFEYYILKKNLYPVKGVSANEYTENDINNNADLFFYDEELDEDDTTFVPPSFEYNENEIYDQIEYDDQLEKYYEMYGYSDDNYSEIDSENNSEYDNDLYTSEFDYE